jgi:hypothetical protein
MAQPGIGTAVVVAALLALGGCGASADDTTCSEYASMEFEDQTSEIRSLLTAHDLEGNDTGNIRSLKASVANFCGSGSGTFVEETSNPDGKLDDAADWSGSFWREKGGDAGIDRDY